MAHRTEFSASKSAVRNPINHRRDSVIDNLRDRKNGRRGSVLFVDADSPSKGAGKLGGLGKHLPPLPLGDIGSRNPQGGKSGSKTERFGRHHLRLDSLSVPNNRTMPVRPPTAANAILPGMNNRYSRPIRTPAKERSAGERGGHAGMVTKRSRDMLTEDMVMPLLDMAAYSLNADTQNLVAPAMAALAGVASNRKVLSSFGAVDVMLRLAEGGKTAKVRLDAWDAVLQLIRSSQACQRLFELDGLDMAMRCASDSHVVIRRKAACVVARLLSKDRLKITERASVKNITGLCAFVISSDSATSLAAGSALLKVVKSVLEVTLKLETECLDQIVNAVVNGRSVINLVSPDRTLINKGHSNALLALSVLTQDKEICSRLARAENLAKVLKKLYEHGVAMGRATSEEDVYFSRIISNLCMTCRTHDMLSDHDVLSNLVAALPRMLLVLAEAMPRDHVNPFRSKTSSVAIIPEQLLLPSEVELQHNIILSIGRFLFCLTIARIDVLQAGYLPCLIELSHSRTIKIRQNAAICIFYLVQDKEVQECFPRTPNEKGVLIPDPFGSLLSLLKNSTDLLVRLTVLRSVKSLCHVALNVSELDKRGISTELEQAFELANKHAIRDPHLMQSSSLFPVLKCAFCATDIVFVMNSVAEESRKTPEGGALMKDVIKTLNGDSSNNWGVQQAESRGSKKGLNVLEGPPPSQLMKTGTYRRRRSSVGAMSDVAASPPGSPLSAVGSPRKRGEKAVEIVTVKEAAWEDAWRSANGLFKMAHESMLLYLDAFADIAASAMAGAETKKHLEIASRRDHRAMERLKVLQAAASKHEAGHDEDRLRKIFKRYDVDLSGEIDGDELYSLLRDLGHLCTRDEAMRIMSGMDSSGDGSVDFAEFEAWWKNAPFTSMFASSNINR